MYEYIVRTEREKLLITTDATSCMVPISQSFLLENFEKNCETESTTPHQQVRYPQDST